MITSTDNFFELRAENGPLKDQRIPFFVRVCPDATCSCRILTIILEKEMAIPGSETRPAPRCEFRMNLATGKSDCFLGQTAPATRRMEEFLGSRGSSDLESLTQIHQEQKQQIILESFLGEIADWRSDTLDLTDLVGIHEVFPLLDYLKFVFQGQEYWIDDQYCCIEGCRCRKMALSFAPAPKNPDAPRFVQACTIRFDLADSTVMIETKDEASLAEQLTAAWMAQCPHFATLLKKRYARVRQVVAELPPAHPELPEAPTATYLPMRVGRNAPCPCGSGKKYKRCCGA